MALQLTNLDSETRQHMVAELDYDLARDSLYRGAYLSDTGHLRYPPLLREALVNGDDASLALALGAAGLFLLKYERRKPKGGFTLASVPHTAPVTLAEGEFNRFYLRGLCQRVIAGGGGSIVIYRARASANPRAESEVLVGTLLDAEQLLLDLRTNTGVDTAFRLPPGPNSGLSGRLNT
jgi:hypothetical protein